MVGSSTNSLARRRTAPPGGRISYVKMPDGLRLRVGMWEPEGRTYRGAILFLQGRAEFIEKHFETYWDLLDRGFAVMTFDWRGQGLSGRDASDPIMDHIESFELRLSDLEYIRQRTFCPKFKAPFYLIGHSMGGHLLLRHMLRWPNAFSRYVALSPLLGIAPGPIPEPLLRLVTRIAVKFGWAQRYMLTQKALRTMEEDKRAQDRLTRDPMRQQDTIDALSDQPGLHLGGVSFGWMYAVFRSCNRLLKEAAEMEEPPPVMILLSEDEQLVDNGKTKSFIEALPVTEWDMAKDARHELLKETDDVRAWTLGKIMRFLRRR